MEEKLFVNYNVPKGGMLEDGSARVDAMARELDIVREALPAVWRRMSGA